MQPYPYAKINATQLEIISHQITIEFLKFPFFFIPYHFAYQLTKVFESVSVCRCQCRLTSNAIDDWYLVFWNFLLSLFLDFSSLLTKMSEKRKKLSGFAYKKLALEKKERDKALLANVPEIRSFFKPVENKSSDGELMTLLQITTL